MLFLFSWSSISALAQESMLDKKVTISFVDIGVESALKQLERQEKILFAYNNSIIIPKEQLISLSIEDLKIHDILRQIFRDNDITFQQVGDKIVIFRQRSTSKQRQLNSSSKWTISGRVIDKSSGEYLLGAIVSIPELDISSTTDSYGLYSLTVESGSYKIETYYAGFESYSREVNNRKINNTTNSSDIYLNPMVSQIGEITVTRYKGGGIENRADIGTEHLSLSALNSIPMPWGEKNILKAIQLMPGIGAISETSSGFTVRGSAPEQNLILLDGAPIYSSTHIMGLSSIFNSDALKDITIYKGGMPARFGGRAASLLDVGLKEGNDQRVVISGGVGFITARATIEGPIVKDRGSFILSGRRSHIDIWQKLTRTIGAKDRLYFYDINAKLNYKLDSKNSLFLSSYLGSDITYKENTSSSPGSSQYGFNSGNFGESGESGKNNSTTFRWNHLFNGKLFSNSSLILSNYKYKNNINNGQRVTAGITDYTIKQDFTFIPNPSNRVQFGINGTYHNLVPVQLQIGNNNEDTSSQILEEKNIAIESGVYISNRQKIAKWINAEYGLRVSLFHHLGPGNTYRYNENSQRVDSTSYKRGDIIKAYSFLEPRVSSNFRVNNNSEIKLSYNRMAQYLHQYLYLNGESDRPIEIWGISSELIKPTVVDQYSIGYSNRIKEDKYLISLEAYFKNLDGINDYKDGASISPINDIENSYNSDLSSSTPTNNSSKDLESLLVVGRGRSYGVELNVKKRYGKFTGGISYSFGRSENRIDGINSGEWYNSRYDRKHDLSIVGSIPLTKRGTLSSTWVFYNGTPTTFPEGSYIYDGKRYYIYPERNSTRLKNYRRLDISYHLEGKRRANSRWRSSWDFSIYNISGETNITGYYWETSKDPDGSDITKPKSISALSILPSVTWNFKL